MPKRIRAVLAVFPLASILVAGLLGCSVRIAPEDGVRSSETIGLAASSVAAGPAHDMAVTAIDFDPAWKGGAHLANDNITLLVAVENRGSEVERDVVVEAALLGLPDADVLVNSQATIKEIVPGESQVVRFSNFSSIPLRSAYSLRVEIQPVLGETAQNNNSRIYRLEVTVSSR